MRRGCAPRIQVSTAAVGCCTPVLRRTSGQILAGFVKQLLVDEAACTKDTAGMVLASAPAGLGCPERKFRKALRVDIKDVTKSIRNVGLPHFWKSQNQAEKKNIKKKHFQTIAVKKQCCFLDVP